MGSVLLVAPRFVKDDLGIRRVHGVESRRLSRRGRQEETYERKDGQCARIELLHVLCTSTAKGVEESPADVPPSAGLIIVPLL